MATSPVGVQCCSLKMGFGLGWVHIRCCGNGGYWFRPDGGSLWKSLRGPAQSNQRALAPDVRCLAKARHALAPVLLRGPAAIGHPWPGAANPASMPGCPLRRTCARPLEGACTAKAKRGGLPAGLFAQRLRVVVTDRSHAPRGNAAGDALRSTVDTSLESCARVTRSVTGCIPTRSVGTINSNNIASRLTPTKSRSAHRCCFSPLIRSSVSSPCAFDLDLPRRKAERRFCVVGNPAWMPG
jgi:hypothetical protein